MLEKVNYQLKLNRYGLEGIEYYFIIFLQKN